MSERYKNVAGIIQDGVNAAATEAMKEVQTEGIKYGYSEDPQRTIDQLRADNARKDAEIVRLKSALMAGWNRRHTPPLKVKG